MMDIETFREQTGIKYAPAINKNEYAIAFTNSSYNDFDFEGLTQYANQSNEVFEKIKSVYGSAQEGQKIDQYKYNRKEIFKYIESGYKVNAQKSIEALNQFLNDENKDFVAFDIETMGDTTGENFSVTEIAANEYYKDGTLKKAGINKTIKPTEETLSMLQELVGKLKSDPSSINAMSSHEQRSILDAMRYSQLDDGSNSIFKMTGKGDFHNTVVEKELTSDGKLLAHRIFDNPQKYIEHIESGIQTLTNDIKLDQKGAANLISKYIEKQNGLNKTFVSFNGENFDIPVLKKFMGINGVKVVEPKHSLDIFNAAQTIYQDPNEANKGLLNAHTKKAIEYTERISNEITDISDEKQIDKTKQKIAKDIFGTKDYKMIESNLELSSNANDVRNWKLQSFGEPFHEILGSIYGNQNMAHNAMADTNLTAYVGSLLTKDMSEQVKKANKNLIDIRFNNEKSLPFEYNDAPLQIGDEIVVKKAYKNYAEGDLSFKAIYDEELEKAVVPEFGNNKLVTEGKNSRYIFNGIHEAEIDGKTYNYLHLIQPDTKDESFILREGEKAVDQLVDIFHNHFSGFSFSNKKHLNNRELKQDDNARRAYNRLFSTEINGAESTTTGYSGAEKMYSAARVYQDYKDDRNRGRRERAEALVSEKKATNINEAYRILQHNLDSNGKKAKEKMVENIEQMFLKKDGTVNKKQVENFWRLSGRLTDELPYYEEFFKQTNGKYQRELDEAIELKNETKIKEINRQKNIALNQFHNKINIDETPHFVTNLKVGENGETIDLISSLEAAGKKIDAEQQERLAEIYNESVKEEVEKKYESQINEAKDNPKQVEKIKKQRDLEIQDKQVEVKRGGMPTDIIPLTDEASKKHFQFTNPKTKKKQEVNVSTVEATQRAINRFMNQGVNKNSERKDRMKKDNLVSFVNQLKKENVISRNQQRELFEMINQTDSPWTASNSMAKYLNQNMRSYLVNSKEVESVKTNPYISKIFDGQDGKLNMLIHESLQQAENSKIDYEYDPTSKKAKIELPQNMVDYIDNMEKNILSSIEPNNEKAIKSVLESIKAADPTTMVGMKLNQTKNPSVDFFLYNKENSAEVQNALLKEGKTNNALHINLPLINENGVIRQGDVIANADTTAIFDGKTNSIKLQSTIENVADSLKYNIGTAIEINKESGVDSANKFIKNRIRKTIEEQAGVNRAAGMHSFNDTNIYKGNVDDLIKQSRIRIESAMIQDVMKNGFGPKGHRLNITPDDLMDSAYYMKDGERQIKKNLKFDDLKPRKSLEVKMQHFNWAKEKLDKNIFTNSVKSTHTGEMVSTLDIRNLQTLGSLYEHKRDNLVQMQNLHTLSDTTRTALENVNGVSTKLSYISSGQKRILEGYNDLSGLLEGNFAIMTNEQLQRRIEQMHQTPEGKEILNKEGLLKTDGSLDYIKMPTTFEQQGLLANEVKEQMNYTQSKVYHGDISLAEGINYGDKIKTGDIFAYETLDNGSVKPIQFTGKTNGVLQLNEDGKTSVTWQENAFKYMMNGEKMTARGYSQEFLENLTGMKNIVGVYDTDVVKHKDFGQLMSGKVALITDTVAQQSGNKQKQMIKAVEKAGIGVKWDKEKSLFVDMTGENNFFKANDDIGLFNEKIETLKDSINKMGGSIEWANELEKGNTVEKYRMQFGMAGVADYSHTTDKTGQSVLRRILPSNRAAYEKELKDKYGIEVDLSKIPKEDIQKLKPLNVYDMNKESGVTVGHREMRVLDSMNMPVTSKYIYNEMLAQAKGEDFASNFKKMNPQNQGLLLSGILQDFDESVMSQPEITDNISRDLLRDARANYLQLSSITGDYTPNENEKVYRHDDFKELPISERDANVYKGTFLDMHKIVNENNNKHGFWLELPKVIDANGKETKINIPTLDGETREVDKLFMPFSSENIINGDRVLDETQKMNRQILDAAAKIDRAENMDDKLSVMKHLQNSINEQTKMSVHNITASKGLVGTNILSAKMGTSTAGLYKLVDSRRADAFREQHGISQDTEFSIISEENAKRLGIHSKLAKGEEIYGSHIRYPTFHEGAMQFNRILMDSSIQNNEIHTSEIASVLKEADSDGDYGHMFTIDDGNVQKEWKAYDEKRKEYFAKEIEQIKEKNVGRGKYIDTLDGNESKVLKDLLSADNYKVAMNGSAEEIAAKVAKATIGQASNLNYFLQQVGAEQFANDEDMRYKIARFGQGLEQKIISSKHGGKPIGLELINQIKKGNWNKAKEIDEKYFFDDKLQGGLFTKKFYMDDIAEVIPDAVERYDNGLNANGLRIGTSEGLRVDSPIEAKKIIDGHVDTQLQQSSENKFAQMMRDILDIDEIEKQAIPDIDLRAHFGEETAEDGSSKDHMQEMIEQQQSEPEVRKKPLFERAKEKIPTSFSEAFNNFKESSKMKKGAVGAGLVGAGALIGSFLGNDDTPEIEAYRSKGDAERMNTNRQGANIQVKGKGQPGAADASVSSVSTSIANSNMNNRETNINVNKTDNTNNLNRVWYRDKVQENYQ